MYGITMCLVFQCSVFKLPLYTLPLSDLFACYLDLSLKIKFQAVANVRGVSVEDEAYRGRDEDLDLEQGSQV